MSLDRPYLDIPGTTIFDGYPSDDYKGGQLFGKIDRAKMTQDFVASAQWLKGHALGNGKICVTGCCFGGGMSNSGRHPG